MLKNIVSETRAEITPQILWSIGLKSNKTHVSSLYFHIKLYKYIQSNQWQYMIVGKSNRKLDENKKRIRIFTFSHTIRNVSYRLCWFRLYHRKENSKKTEDKNPKTSKLFPKTESCPRYNLHFSLLYNHIWTFLP